MIRNRIVKILGVFVVAVIILELVYVQRRMNVEWPQPELPLLPICILANVESMETAQYTAKFWPRYPLFFAVWGEFWLQTVITDEQERIYLIPAQKSTHAKGWQLTLEMARRSPHQCEYFFTVDDDLDWFVTDTGAKWYLEQPNDVTWNFGGRDYVSSKVETITNLLTAYLSLRQPAVTVFGWPWGDANLENLMKMDLLYDGKIEQPITTFDNGCLVFHHSIVDFFIPIWLGEGHQPRFIAQHSFLNFFIPYLFQQYASRFNGITFRNPPQVRHPYDSSAEFDRFLMQGSRCPHFGAGIPYKEVWWEVAKRGHPPYDIDLVHLGQFYSLSHSIITGNPYIKSHYTKDQLEKIDAELEKSAVSNRWCKAKLK